MLNFPPTLIRSQSDCRLRRGRIWDGVGEGAGGNVNVLRRVPETGTGRQTGKPRAKLRVGPCVCPMLLAG